MGVLYIGDVLRQVEVALYDDSDIAEVLRRDRTKHIATNSRGILSSMVIDALEHILVHSFAEDDH